MTLTLSGSGNPVTIDGTDSGLTLVRETAKSATGTSIEFTGIPNWVNRITVMLDGVSTNGSSPVGLQLGSGSYATSGYAGATFGSLGSDNTGTRLLSVMAEMNDSQLSTAIRNGAFVITRLQSNTWIIFGNFAQTNTARFFSLSCSVTLSGTLDRLRITTVNGVDTFDAGTINIMYE